MKVTLIEVPYDSGHYGRRMGRGPLHLVQGGLVGLLQQQDHDVRLIEVRLDESFPIEVGAAAETQRLVAECVAAERAEERFPLVLSGNCATAVGTMAGTGCSDTAVVWLDCHGDLNTPDSSPSGFFDGMVLTMLMGDSWKRLAAGVPGFRAVPHERVALVGVRDLDSREEAYLEATGLPLVDVATLRREGAEAALEAALARVSEGTDGAYLHLDLDVLDPSVARINSYQTPDGLSVEEVEAVIHAVAARLPLKSAAVTSYDAEHDPVGRGGEAALRLINALIAAAPQAD